MHVVLLNQPFHPDVVATAQMGKDLADELVRRGHTVSAVASRSIYGQKGGSLPKRETIDGIEIHRVGTSIFGTAGIAARLAAFALFYVLASWRVLTLKKPDVIVGFTTPPFIVGVALAARYIRGAKAVYWVMDLYPDVPVACGVMKPKGLLTRVLERFHRAIMKRVHVNVVLGRCMRDRLLEKGVAEDRIRLIPVWAETGGLNPVDRATNPYREQWNVGDAFCVMYSGNFGLGHDAETITDACVALKDDERLQFLFVGGGKRRAGVQEALEAAACERADFHPYVPREDLAQSLSAGDAHLITVKTGLEGLIVPSKLFGIMAVARPALYIGSPESEVARIITESCCGICVPEGDDAALAEAIRTLASDPERAAEMGRKGRAWLESRYDAATATGMWAELLESLTRDGTLSTQDALHAGTGFATSSSSARQAEPAAEPAA